MEQISTYNIPAGLEALLEVRESGELPRELYEPMQALVRHFTAVAAERPVYAYLFSDEVDAERRDLFAYALMRTLLQHIPSALLVDCDFLGAGMHGLVPEKDALGFLDFLLYGSSLGVITQQAAGEVHVVGAGSFPVTRKMPFVPDAFREAAQRLVNHARCVVFVGPLHDDEGELHPLVAMADLPVLVRDDGVGGGGTAPMEENIAARARRELLSVRIGAAPFEPDEPELAAPELADTEPDTWERTRRDDTPPVLEREAPFEPPGRGSPDPGGYPEEPPGEESVTLPVMPAAAASKPGEPALDETVVDALRPGPLPPSTDARELPPDMDDEPRYTSLVPRILTAVVALLVIAFIAWWFIEERSRPETTALDEVPVQTEEPASPTAAVDDAAEAPAPAATDTAGAAPVVADAGTGAGEPPPPVTPPETTPAPGAVSGPLNAADIHVMAELTDGYTGWYVIHISSFRQSSKAREETAFLTSKGFPVFIVFLDLGEKGKWYRIYSGPFEEREQAREVKKNLDDIPRVRFTRISKVAP